MDTAKYTMMKDLCRPLKDFADKSSKGYKKACEEIYNRFDFESNFSLCNTLTLANLYVNKEKLQDDAKNLNPKRIVENLTDFLQEFDKVGYKTNYYDSYLKALKSNKLSINLSTENKQNNAFCRFSFDGNDFSKNILLTINATGAITDDLRTICGVMRYLYSVEKQRDFSKATVSLVDSFTEHTAIKFLANKNEKDFDRLMEQEKFDLQSLKFSSKEMLLSYLLVKEVVEKDVDYGKYLSIPFQTSHFLRLKNYNTRHFTTDEFQRDLFNLNPITLRTLSFCVDYELNEDYPFGVDFEGSAEALKCAIENSKKHGTSKTLENFGFTRESLADYVSSNIENIYSSYNTKQLEHKAMYL